MTNRFDSLQLSIWAPVNPHNLIPQNTTSTISSIDTSSFGNRIYNNSLSEDDNPYTLQRSRLGWICKESRFCRAVSPFLKGILVGILTCGVGLATILTLYLTSGQRESTTASTTFPTTTIFQTTETTFQTTTTTSSEFLFPISLCKTTCPQNETLISLIDLMARWRFDNNYIDDTNKYNATSINGNAFINRGYVKTALSFNASQNQYLVTSYIPLAAISFSVETWIYVTAFTGATHQSIIGLCSSPTSHQCLHFTVYKNGSTAYLYMSFYDDDCVGTKPVTSNKWIHAAFVFDSTSLTQSIYFDGILDNTCTASAPFAGTTGTVTIGNVPDILGTSGSNYFQGYIDQLTIVNGVRSACQILEDATFAACFLFENGSELVDSGPNSLSAVSSSAAFVSSTHSPQAISFDGSNSSYFQVSGFTGLGTSNKPFSISLWIRPRNLSGAVVHVSSFSNGLGWCFPFIGFSTNGSLLAQMWKGGPRTLVGPILPLLSLSHVVETWSSTNGIRLYVNNSFIGSQLNDTASFLGSGLPDYVTLANLLGGTGSCNVGLIGRFAFDGDIDDFRVYSRELNAAEINILYQL